MRKFLRISLFVVALLMALPECAMSQKQSAELPLHYGDILFALNERFMADTYWKRALEMGADKEAIEKRLAIPKDVKDARVEELIVEDNKKKKEK